jgi:hypothetical protein
MRERLFSSAGDARDAASAGVAGDAERAAAAGSAARGGALVALGLRRAAGGAVCAARAFIRPLRSGASGTRRASGGCS